MQNRDHPFLRPLWRRVALVALCLAWAAAEFVGGSPMWGMMVLAMAAYGAWHYLYRYGTAGSGNGPDDGPGDRAG